MLQQSIDQDLEVMSLSHIFKNIVHGVFPMKDIPLTLGQL